MKCLHCSYLNGELYELCKRCIKLDRLKRDLFDALREAADPFIETLPGTMVTLQIGSSSVDIVVKS